MACSSANVRDEAPSAGVRLGCTLLAGMTPGSADGCTAEGLGAHNATELTLTHLVVDLSKTGSCPVVCNGEETEKCYFLSVIKLIPTSLT